MAGCASPPHSIRLAGPVTGPVRVKSRSRAVAPPVPGLLLTLEAGLALAAVAISCADVGRRLLALLAVRGSCRGLSSGLALPSAALSFPGDLGNSGNAIGVELNLCWPRQPPIMSPSPA